MKLKEPFLDSVSFEIKYSHGHLYFDRCGQTLVDIEKLHDGWIAGLADNNSGTIESFDDNFRVQFNNGRYNFWANKASKHSMEYIAHSALSIWKVIQANLNLYEFSRIGCRFQFLLAAKSVDDSSKLINKSSFKQRIPGGIIESGFSVKTSKIDTTLVRDEREYHIKLSPVIRSESVDPSSLVNVDPRSLPKNQQKVRMEKLKRLNEYSVNPMYAVHLDVDCSEFHPEDVFVDDYICESYKIVKDDFYFLIGELWGR